MRNILDDAQTLFEYTRELRRDFHRYPELGFKEIRTANIIAKELTNLGLEVKTEVPLPVIYQGQMVSEEGSNR